MGDFDDVLALDPGDDWDLFHLGTARVGDEMPDVAASLRLPGAVVELRGHVPEELVAGLADLMDPSLVSDSGETVAMVLRAPPGGPADDAVELTSGGGTKLVRHDDLVSVVVAELDQLLLATDSDRLHLDAACVEIGGTGIALTGEVEHRAAVLDALVRRGARLVASTLLTVVPGSHTVLGYPVPLPGGRPAGPGRAAPYTVVEVVVHLGPVSGGVAGPGDGSGPRTCSRPDSCRTLIDRAVDRARFGAATLDALAGIACDASHWWLDQPDPEAASLAVEGLTPPPRRSFGVVHRFDERREPRSEAGRLPASMRIARFSDGALALDGVSGTTLALHEDEADALETLLVGGPGSRQGSPGLPIQRLIDAGVVVPDTPLRRPVPGPEAFGLPNCPVGATARSMWSETASGAGAEGAAEELDGLSALAILRGVWAVDGAIRESALEVHSRVQHAVVSVERQLLQTITLLEESGIEPIVLGSVVHAHDGPLPPYFAESEEIDLLVGDSEFADALRALLVAGHSRIGPPLVGDGTTHGVLDLAPNETPGASVRLRDTLSTGPFGALVDHEEFHRRAIPIRVHRRWCRSLHPEHRFVHACVRVDQDGPAVSMQRLRDVVLAAPRSDALLARALEASERWGATASVTAAVRRVADELPGLPTWLVERSTRADAVPEHARRGTLRRNLRARR